MLTTFKRNLFLDCILSANRILLARETARMPINPVIGYVCAFCVCCIADYAHFINKNSLSFILVSFCCRFETTNGIKSRQTSYMVGNERVVSGFYSYFGPDGKIYTVNYIADRNGYRATGSHLPVQPSVAVQPLPPSQPNFGYPSSTPLPFVSSTPLPPQAFTPSSPVYVPSSTPYNRPGHYYVPSSTPSPFYSQPTYLPPSSPAPPIYNQPSYLPPSSTPFPVINGPSPSPFPGYSYQRPAPTNTAYLPPSASQSPAPVFYSPSDYQSYRSTTSRPITRFSLAVRQPNPDFASASSTFAPPTSTLSPIVIDDNAPIRNQYVPPNDNYIPPAAISSTPQPFNTVSSVYQQPDNTIYITPKPFLNHRRSDLPNSLSINRELLPPYLSVNGLDAIDNNYRRSDAGGRVVGPSVRPLTVTNLNYQPNDY